MSDTFLIKRSAVAAKVPTIAQMSIGEVAVNTYDGKLYLRGNNGADFVKEVGALPASSYPSVNLQAWNPVAGFAPTISNEYDELVWLFAQGSVQALTVWLKVPSAYTVGRQIKTRNFFYTPSASNAWQVQVTSTLIRSGFDDVTTSLNQQLLYSGDITNATANVLREIVIPLTDATGKINSVAISPADMLKVRISRVAPTATEDTSDLRLVPSGSEFTF